jgi:hypothetical protein
MDVLGGRTGEDRTLPAVAGPPLAMITFQV